MTIFKAIITIIIIVVVIVVIVIIIRMWDVDKDENYILQVNEGPSTNPAGIISSISFSSKGFKLFITI